MLLLLLILLVGAVGVAGAGLLGIGTLSIDSRKQRTGVLAAVSAPVVLVFGVVVLAAVVLGVGGGREQGDPPPPASTRPTASAPTTVLEAQVQRTVRDLPVVGIATLVEGSFVTSPPVGELSPGGVVRVLASGFDSFERGRAQQCVVELGRRSACAVPIPVQFDERGQAEFLFVLQGDVSPGGCRAGQATCVLRLTGEASGRQGDAQTIMVDRAVPGAVSVSPSRALAGGRTVEIAVTGFPVSTTATAVLCGPPGGYEIGRCSAPLATFGVDAGGSGRTTFVVELAAVPCGAGTPCAVTVLAGPGYHAAPAVPVTFSAGPGVAYSADRVLTGLLAAVVLLGLATAIALRTDWSKPTEAATPDMDRSDLRSGDSLDDLFGTDEELDARDPVPW